MSFSFINNGQEYTYNGNTGEVTGQKIRDPIKYSVDRVNECLRTGLWTVVTDVKGFPRPGVNAKFEKAKVFVVGKSFYHSDMWVIERSDGSLCRVRNGMLVEIENIDDQAFEIMKDLSVSYDQAVRMINKGYGKV